MTYSYFNITGNIAKKTPGVKNALEKNWINTSYATAESALTAPY